MNQTNGEKKSRGKFFVSAYLWVVFVAVLLAVFFTLFWGFGARFGFPKTWAMDCGCLGVKRMFEDEHNVPRCSCYGYTYWFWLE